MDDILGPEFSSYEACNEASDGARSCYTIIDSGACPGNSYLANLRNEEEYNFVLTFYNSSNYITIISKNHHFNLISSDNFKGSFYIDATDVASEGTWVDRNGQPVYTTFLAGEPNGGTSENCLELRSEGLMNDLPCGSDGHPSLCKIDL